jgi:hypothetical protein
VLEGGVPDPPEWIRRQAEPLRALGWVEGQNLQVERRYADGRTEAFGLPLRNQFGRRSTNLSNNGLAIIADMRSSTYAEP